MMLMDSCCLRTTIIQGNNLKKECCQEMIQKEIGVKFVTSDYRQKEEHQNAFMYVFQYQYFY